MTRALDTNQTNALSASHISGISFVELDFSTPLYLCSLPYNFAWNSITWTGAGSLGSISPVGENGDLQAQGVQLSLTGVDSSLVSTALGEAYQGKPLLPARPHYRPVDRLANPSLCWTHRHYGH